VTDLVSDSLEVAAVLFEGFEVRRERTRAALEEGFLMATELAEYLVGRGVPFRAAHRRVGELVRYCIETGKDLPTPR
jgi:argininosuccinate lyase